jgi:hypothetical protein
VRTFKDMMGSNFGGDGVGVAAAGGPANDGGYLVPNPNAQVGSEPLGNLTGAPPWVTFRTYQIIPEVGLANNGGPTLVVPSERASRLVTFTAPLVGFTIFIGDSGVRANPGGSGLALPAGLPYQIPIPGNQTVHAITDAPVFLTLRVQIGPLLAGDRERVY